MNDLMADARQALGMFRAITVFAWLDVRLRYQRTALGPFWVIVSSAVWVGTVGIASAYLFNQDIATFLPYIAVGILGWSFFVAVLSEVTTVFASQKSLILSFRLPVFFYVFRLAVRNIIVFFHISAIAFVVVLIFGDLDPVHLLLFPLVVLMYFLAAVILALILGIVGSRFVDITQLVQMATNIFLIITPIFWKKSFIEGNDWFVNWNPVYHFLEIYRATFLYDTVPLFSFLYCGVAIAIGIFIAGALFARYRRYVPYWI